MAVNYSNSSLVDYTKISPNKNTTRVHNVYNPTGKITKITIHHMAGNLSVETCGDVFAPTSRQGSSNYGIGSDGRVGLYVDEKHRAWTSGSPDNDYKAVTIEVANDGDASTNWHVSDKAYAKLIDLCVDICKRNGISKLNYTGDATGNLTRHNMFQATVCPGPYLQSKFEDIAEKVNKRLGSSTVATKTPFLIKVDSRKVGKGNVLNIREEPNVNATIIGKLPYNDPHTYTIIKVDGDWGLLKSRVGWINLYYTKIVSGTTSAETVIKKPDVIYQVYADGRWWSEITNYNETNSNGYAGVLGKEISGIRVKLSNGKTVSVMSHISGNAATNWLSEVTKWDNTSDGYSGWKGKPTDCLAMKADGYTLKYRVHVKGGNWLGWISKYDIKDSVNGVAGIYGKPIDAVQIMVV